MPTRQQAMRELDRFARMSVEHSLQQYGREGTLQDKARETFDEQGLWDAPWVPDDFDLGRATRHPVYTDVFSRQQQLAWNHLQWGLDYSIVGRGEQQLIVLNGYAVQAFDGLMPSLIQLEQRESYEEIDHFAAFSTLLERLRARYFPHRRRPLYADSPSGFHSERVNRVMRHVIGVVGTRTLGNHFPALYFLARGLKTHNFKPFENGIAAFEQAPRPIREISHLHRLDESRHMATALWIARYANQVLETAPQESRALFKAAVHAAWPPGRMEQTRIAYWRTVLDEALPFRDLPHPEREALFEHVAANIRANLHDLHERQKRLTRQANKRIVEECGLPLELKRIFVAELRRDPVHRTLVDSVELPEA